MLSNAAFCFGRQHYLRPEKCAHAHPKIVKYQFCNINKVCGVRGGISPLGPQPKRGVGGGGSKRKRPSEDYKELRQCWIISTKVYNILQEM